MRSDHRSSSTSASEPTRFKAGPSSSVPLGYLHRPCIPPPPSLPFPSGFFSATSPSTSPLPRGFFTLLSFFIPHASSPTVDIFSVYLREAPCPRRAILCGAITREGRGGSCDETLERKDQYVNFVSRCPSFPKISMLLGG